MDTCKSHKFVYCIHTESLFLCLVGYKINIPAAGKELRFQGLGKWFTDRES